MLEIELKKKFTKDLKKHILNQEIELEIFDLVIENLRNQIPLDEKFKDHALVGEYKGVENAILNLMFCSCIEYKTMC